MATLYAYSPNGTQATLSYSVIGFTQSLQQNGWCKLPNGLILQWGFKQGPFGNGIEVPFIIKLNNFYISNTSINRMEFGYYWTDAPTASYYLNKSVLIFPDSGSSNERLVFCIIGD